MPSPSPNGTNGRSVNGRFAIGNVGGPGNPLATKVGKLRSVLLNSVSDEDMQAIVTKLVSLAKAGDLAAAKLLLDRTTGRFVDKLPSFKPKTQPLRADLEPGTIAGPKPNSVIQVDGKFLKRTVDGQLIPATLDEMKQYAFARLRELSRIHDVPAEVS